MMVITNSTKLEKFGKTFLDTDNDFFQQFEIYIDGKKSDIEMTVTSDDRTYHYSGETYKALKDACIAAGYEWAVKNG